MFLRIEKWLERSDEMFLKEFFTEETRRQKIEKLRRRRIFAFIQTIIPVGGIVCILPLFLVAIILCVFVDIAIVPVLVFLTVTIFVLLSLGFVLFSTRLAQIDTEIKMFLVQDSAGTS